MARAQYSHAIVFLKLVCFTLIVLNCAHAADEASCAMGDVACAAGGAVCAEVKIEISQELTLERQGFDTRMKINNEFDSIPLEAVTICVNFPEFSKY